MYEKKVSDAQFHQYEKNEVTFDLKSLNTKRPQHMALEIQVLALNRHKNETETSFLDN
jgi:hypothetical protein